MLTAVILAAGESSRMGSPKALVPFRGRTFLDHLLEVAHHAKLPARVVLGAHAAEISATLALDPEIVIHNPSWQQGQLSSIQAAIRSLPENRTEGVVLFLVDHPLVSATLVEKLVAEFHRSGRLIVLPTFEGKRGHPVIFSRALFAELLGADPAKGARAVVWAHAGEVFEVPTEEEGILLNLNDPETARRALR